MVCKWKKQWRDDVSLTADVKPFQTVGAEMQKARAVVTVSVGGTVNSIKIDERGKRTCKLILDDVSEKVRWLLSHVIATSLYLFD